jgi:hypothetical protein
MTEGSAQTFSSDYINNVLGKGAPETWAQFVVRLEKYFLDPDAKEKAREKLGVTRALQTGTEGNCRVPHATRGALPPSRIER